MTGVFSICLEQWNMTRAQTPEFLIMVTRPCTSTATRQEKLCASSVMKATSSLATSSSTVSLAIPLSGATRHRSAEASSSSNLHALLCNWKLLDLALVWLVWFNMSVLKCVQWPTRSFWTITSWKVSSFFPWKLSHSSRNQTCVCSFRPSNGRIRYCQVICVDCQTVALFVIHITSA